MWCGISKNLPEVTTGCTEKESLEAENSTVEENLQSSWHNSTLEISSNCSCLFHSLENTSF